MLLDPDVNHVLFWGSSCSSSSSSSNNIQDQCLVITDIYGVREKGVWLKNKQKNNNNQEQQQQQKQFSCCLMLLDRGANHVRFWG